MQRPQSLFKVPTKRDPKNMYSDRMVVRKTNIEKVRLACDWKGKYKSKINENERKGKHFSSIRARIFYWKVCTLRSGGFGNSLSLALIDYTQAEFHLLLSPLTKENVKLIANETRQYRSVSAHLRSLKCVRGKNHVRCHNFYPHPLIFINWKEALIATIEGVFPFASYQSHLP